MTRIIAAFSQKMELKLFMVRKERLELSRLTALEPKSSASTNSATFAWDLFRSLKLLIIY